MTFAPEEVETIKQHVTDALLEIQPTADPVAARHTVELYYRLFNEATVAICPPREMTHDEMVEHDFRADPWDPNMNLG